MEYDLLRPAQLPPLTASSATIRQYANRTARTRWFPYDNDNHCQLAYSLLLPTLGEIVGWVGLVTR